VQRQQQQDRRRHQHIGAPDPGPQHDRARPAGDMVGDRAYARRVDDDDQHEHPAAEGDVGGRHDLREVLQKRQLRDVARHVGDARGIAGQRVGQRRWRDRVLRGGYLRNNERFEHGVGPVVSERRIIARHPTWRQSFTEVAPGFTLATRAG
jgi:hypothetical protein